MESSGKDNQGEEKPRPDETLQRLSLFLYSMQTYEHISNQLPVSEGLRQFDGRSSTSNTALASIESDCVAIDVRLMLQRKYFSNKEKVQLKKLIRVARNVKSVGGEQIEVIVDRLKAVNSKPIELALADGTIISEQYANAEDATYGVLLHADMERSLRLQSYPEEMRLLSLSPYVLSREEVLFDFRDLLEKSGIESLQAGRRTKAPVLRWRETSRDERGIVQSPYWSNFAGRDLDDSELYDVAKANTLDDNLIVMTVFTFINLLRAKSLDVPTLRKLVWRDFWNDWGDFEQAAQAVRAIPEPGFSSRIKHEGGHEYAQVTILPEVIKPWVTNVPQLFVSNGCTVCLIKRGGIWKVNGIAI